MRNESTDRIVGQLEGSVRALQASMTEVKATLAGQDDKLDQLLAHHNRRKGARALFQAVFSLAASGGFLGWAWEHFRK